MPSESNTDPPELSIVIPAHNEADRILPYLQTVTNYLRNRDRSHEILVVNDGSASPTVGYLYARIRLISLPRRRGKGAAVRLGMQEASG
ncbi:glycosyltransferase [Petrachloros mirabilis]